MQTPLSSRRQGTVLCLLVGLDTICYNTGMSGRIRKLIALDLDGTLLTTQKRITDRTKKALEGAFAAGLEPVVVTGRPLSGLPEELEEIPQIRYAITSNGAVTTDLHTGTAFRSRLIQPSIAEKIVPVPEEAGWIYSVFINGIGYCNPATYGHLRKFFAGTVLDTYVQRSRRRADDMESLIRASAGVENIWIVCNNPEQAASLGDQIQKQWDLQIFRTAPNDIEAGALGADKGAALKDLYQFLKIKRENVFAIGDNHNDLTMLQTAGTAIAMGNATEEIRRIAHQITDTNDEDGVAKVLETL